MAGIISLLQECEEFSKVLHLQEYLSSFFPNLSNELEFNSSFTQFLQHTIICLSRDYSFPTIFSFESKHTHSSLVDNIVYNLLRKTSSGSGLRLEEPTQTLGYSTYTHTGALRKNPSLTLTLKTTNWETLHKYIGSELTAHILNGNNLIILEKVEDAYIETVGTNLAEYLKIKSGNFISKRENIRKFRDFKNFLKMYKNKLQDRKTKKEDILNKLPLVNRTRMLYSPIIRKKKWFASRHPLNLDPEQAGAAIAKTILGEKTGEKYFQVLSGFFTHLAKNLKKVNIGAHLNNHCPLPEEFQKYYDENLQKNFTFEWLFDENCSTESVFNYVITLLLKIMPKPLLSFNSNKRAFNKSIVMFLRMGTWEKISCAGLCIGYKFSKITWLKEPSDTARRLLIGKILYWIFNDFLVPLLQNSFYITEKQHQTTQLYYYRKPVWAIAQEKAKEKLEESCFFNKITPFQASMCQDFTEFPHAKLRIQPKPSDFRPIMHFKSKINVSANMRLSGNNLLAGIPQILKNSISPSEKISVLDYPSAIKVLEDFKAEWIFRGKPFLYFMTMDIAKAFDSVKLEELRDIIWKLKLPIVSSYYKFIQLNPRLRSPDKGPLAKLMKLKFKKHAYEEGKFPLFQDLPFIKDSINIPTSKTLINTTDKLKMIERILLGNIIKFNRQFFKAEKGIPQGLSCSPLLSNIYFSEFELFAVESMKDEIKTNLFFVTRLHDDYLVLSDTPALIETFLEKMNSLGDEHGFSFKKEKITSNIQAPWVTNYEESIKGWVGLNIDEELDIVPNVSPSLNKTVSCEFLSAKSTNSEIRNKLVKLMNLSINLLNNRASASSDKVSYALKKLMELQATRFLGFLKTLRKFYKVKHSDESLSRLIVQIVKQSSILCSKVENFEKITLKAFIEVFENTSMHSLTKRISSYLNKLN